MRKLRASHADRIFRARLQLLARDRVLMAALSAERRDYVSLAVRAMDWWISSGMAGGRAPSTIALREAAPPRDRIIAAYLEAHPREDLGRAFEAIRAQADHLANH